MSVASALCIDALACYGLDIGPALVKFLRQIHRCDDELRSLQITEDAARIEAKRAEQEQARRWAAARAQQLRDPFEHDPYRHDPHRDGPTRSL